MSRRRARRRSTRVIGKPRRRVDGRAKVTGQTRFADDIDPAADAARQAAALAASARAHRAHRHVEGRSASGRAPRADRRGAPDSVRHPARQPRRARALSGQRALRRRSGRGRDRARRGDRRRRARAHRRRVRAAARRSRRPRTASPIPSRASTTTATSGNIHKVVALQFGDVDAALAGADHVFDDVFFFEGNTHLPLEQHAAVALKDPDGKLVALLEHADAALRASRARQGARDAGRAHPRDRDAQRRRLRRQERSVQPRDRRRQGGDDARSARQDLPDARGGLLLPSRPASRADALPDRRDERRPASRASICRRCSTAARTDRTASASTFYTGALQTVTYSIPRYRFRGCRVFTNKPPCGPKRGHGTPQSRFGQEVQLDKIARRARDRSRRAAPEASSRRRTRSPRTTCASARSASPSASGA